MLIKPQINYSKVKNLYNQKTETNFRGQNIIQTIAKPSVNDETAKMLYFCCKKYNYKVKKPLQWGLKRAFDYTLASSAIILTSPIMLLTAVAIKLDSKGPVIFKQTRLGLKSRPFTIYKFRSMTVNDEKNFKAGKHKNDPRVTKVGKFIRKFSIDEIPQFFNILKGDMSVVGPRPLPMENQKNLIQENPDSIKRYAVMPGAMLKYTRDKDISNQDRIKDEIAYIENWSLKKDFKEFFMVAKDIVTGNNF